MANGTVQWFEKRRGIGFIREDSGVDIFVNMEAVENSGMTTLEKNQRLSFDIHKDPENNKAPAAKNLKAVGHG